MWQCHAPEGQTPLLHRCAKLHACTWLNNGGKKSWTRTRKETFYAQQTFNVRSTPFSTKLYERDFYAVSKTAGLWTNVISIGDPCSSVPSVSLCMGVSKIGERTVNWQAVLRCNKSRAPGRKEFFFVEACRILQNIFTSDEISFSLSLKVRAQQCLR
jgi:hypothetical protein